MRARREGIIGIEIERVGTTRRYDLCVLVLLGLSTLLLVLRAWTLSGDGSLQLSGFGNTLALFALLFLLGDLRGVVGVVIGESLLLARHLVLALGFVLAGVGLY